MKRLFFYICSLTMFLCSCQNSDYSKCELISVDNSTFDKWETVFKIDSVIPLGVSDSISLTLAKECIYDNSQLYFLDYKLKKVYKFDENGNLCYSCGVLGSADNEYINPKDIELSIDKKTLYVLDDSGILSFDALTGKFINKTRLIDNLQVKSYGIIPESSENMLLYTPLDNESTIMKLINNKSLLSLRQKQSQQLIVSPFVRHNDDIFVIPNYGCFDIDMYEDNTLVHKYAINIEDNMLPKKYLKNVDDLNKFNEVDDMPDYFKCITSLTICGNSLLIKLVGPKQKYYTVLYNTKIKRSVAGPSDINSGISFVGSDDEFLYAICYLDYLESNSPYYEQLKSYLSNDYSNPLLLKVKIDESKI